MSRLDNYGRIKIGKDCVGQSWLNGLRSRTQTVEFTDSKNALERYGYLQIFGPVKAAVMLQRLSRGWVGEKTDQGYLDLLATLTSGSSTRMVEFTLTTFFDARSLDYRIAFAVRDAS